MTAQELKDILLTPPQSMLTNSSRGEIIRLSNVTLDSVDLIETISLNRNIVFQNVIFGNCNLKCIKTSGFIRMTNCSSLEGTSLVLSFNSEDFIFQENQEFKGGVKFDNCKILVLIIVNGLFSEHVEFVNSEITAFQIAGESNFKRGIYFRKVNAKLLAFFGGILKKLYIGSGLIEKVHVHGDIHITELLINGGTFEEIKIDCNGIKETNIYKKNKESEEDKLDIKKINFKTIGSNHIKLRKFSLKILSFSDGFCSKDSNVFFNGLNVDEISFSKYTNYGQINFNETTVSSILQFLNSDVGKLSFIGCNFQTARIDFLKSKIIETFIIGCEFPKKFANDSYSDQIEAYSQIKKIYENRGSQKDALEYYSMEMNALDESLNCKDNFWEKVTLWFNKKSTNHGLDWKQGLKSTLVVSLGFFLAYIISLRSYTPNPFKWEYWCELGNVFSHFFDFINPTHKTDIVAEKLNINPDPLSRIIEGLSRIFIAYFIYQLIQAFRKHGKK